MPTRRIAVTGSAEFQALGTGGTLAVDQWDALTAQIADAIGPDHAALFAEPQRNPGRGEIDWYADGAGAVVRADSLPAAEREALLARWHAMRAEIAALAAKLGARPEGRFMASLIQAAITLPQPEDRAIYRIDGRPVLIAWGHERAGVAAGAETLTGRMAAAELPMAILPPPPGPVPPGPRLWPVLAALIGSLLLLLLALLFAWRDPFGWLAPQEVACSVSQEDLAALGALREASERESALRRELARLVTEAANRRAACPPLPAPRPQPQQPAQEPPRNPDLERAQREGGQTGKLQIVLAWESRSDVDLHVTCPNGQRLFWGARAVCGGALDVDANAERQMAQPVENAVWANPGSGTYRVEVENYAANGTNNVPFRVTIRQEGRPDRVVTGVARAGAGRQPVTTVDVP
ncbi:hypothetical protein JYK14_15205 [Siccirubricoccus sp. KC 17139]|uniref:Uncharacterized protein n=1 Tax=Siccirubricoccus soli TaxID=2899147 RepID=A0ABT1D6E0_9PROT|nr:hypothetical protein [Siccirubricoccus soli]MCO6417498.1 hypothetical protein [Siccirubricoccus soli]MCP2683633.1 hypothetical protein [Siccirubricoccus soli]